MLKFVAILLAITTTLCYGDEKYDTNKPIQISHSYYLISKEEKHRLRDQLPRVRRLKFKVNIPLNRPLVEPNLQDTILYPALQQISSMLRVKYNPSEGIIYTRVCVNDSFEHVEYNNQTIAACLLGCENETMIPESLRKNCFTKSKNGSIHLEENKGAIVKDADLFLSVNWVTCVHKYALAGSGPVQLSMINDRPVVGIIQLCENNWHLLKSNEVKIKIIQHEVFHIMGFTPSLYAFFRNMDGSPRTERNKFREPVFGQFYEKHIPYFRPSNNTMIFVNTTEDTPDGIFERSVPYLVTENLRDLARRYYNCQELVGVPLEDLMSVGSYASHFDQRIINYEMMAPKSSKKMVISNFTLTFFLDSGWYLPNFDKAEPFEYGRNLGCDFVLKNCYEYMVLKKQKNESTFPYCDKCFITDPSNKHVHEPCALYYKAANNDIKDRYLYTEDKNLIATNQFSDYCPIYKSQHYSPSFNETWCVDKTVYKDCSIKVPNEDWFWNDCEEQYNVTKDDLGCLEYQCSIKYGMLVKVNGELFQCRPNVTIAIESIKGKLILQGKFLCPTCDKYCKTMCSSDLKIYKKSKKSKEEHCNSNKANPRHNSNVPEIMGFLMLLLFISYY